MNSKSATSFGLVLRQLRAEAGLTQEQLGIAAGLERNFISMLELGQRGPSLETVFMIAAALRVDADKFVRLVCEKIKEQDLST